MSMVTLIKGTSEVEMIPSQITCEAVSRVFSVNPVTVWLKEEYGSRAYFPESDGSFNIPNIILGSLKVNGTPLVVERASADHHIVPPSTNPNHTISVATGSKSALGNSPIFKSVVAHRSRHENQSVTVKIIQATLTFPNGKANFQKIGQIYIDVVESTATVLYISSVIRAEFGDDYVLVTNDGLELTDGTGTKGLKFWKAPNRKLFSVPSEELMIGAGPSRGKKRCRSSTSTAENLYSTYDIDEVIAPLSEKIETIVVELADIRFQMKDAFKLTKKSNIPVGLHKSIIEAFQCKICRNLISPPIILAKCCRSILGCGHCTDQWYSGGGGLTKCCPSCNTERGYAETMRIAGIDDFIESVKPLFDDGETGTNQ